MEDEFWRLKYEGIFSPEEQDIMFMMVRVIIIDKKQFIRKTSGQ